MPVGPAVAFKFHPAPTVPLLFEGVPYNRVRAPGDVAVAKLVIVVPSNVAANIRTAALAEAVVIEVTPEIVVVQPDVHVE